MSAPMAGLLLGLVLAVGFFLFSRALSRRVELEETRQALRISSMVQFVIMPGLGYLAGWLITGD